MAATMAVAVGHDSARSKRTHRLGSQEAEAHAQTWETFATAVVRRNGAGYAEIRRGSETFRLEWSGESSPLSATIFASGSAVIPQTRP